MRRLIDPVPEPAGPCRSCGSLSWIDLTAIPYATMLQDSIDEHRTAQRDARRTVLRRGLLAGAYVAFMLRELPVWHTTWQRLASGMPLGQVHFHWLELAVAFALSLWLVRALTRWRKSRTLPVVLHGRRPDAGDDLTPFGRRRARAYSVALYRGDDATPRLVVSAGAPITGRMKTTRLDVDTTDPGVVRWMHTHGLDAAVYTWRAVEMAAE